MEFATEGDQRVRVLAVGPARQGRLGRPAGPDWTGRQLEVVAVIEQGRVVAIHAMDARPKLIRLYTERIDDGAT